MMLTALLCITSPAFAQISYLTKPQIIAQNQSGLSIEQQARSHFNKGEFSQAVQLFQESMQKYAASGNITRQALSLSNLSLSYQQLGQWNNASDSITKAINLLKDINNPNNQTDLALAQAFDIQGSLQLARGQANPALESWKKATDVYIKLNKPAKVLVSKTNQAQALQNLGLYHRAITLLQTALKLQSESTNSTLKLKSLLQQIPTSPETAAALHTLGDSLRVVGNFSQAQLVLQRSLDIAKQSNLPEIITLSQLGLANTARAQLSQNNKTKNAGDSQATQTALNYYQQAAKSNSENLRVQALVNQLSLLVDINKIEAAKKLISPLKQQIDSLPPSRSAIEARLHLAHAMMQISKQNNTIPLREIAANLAVAVRQATELSHPRLQADALISLGNIYEQSQQWQEAEEITKQALQFAQQAKASDITYRSQWQLGRILKAQGKTERAIYTYQQAVSSIKSLRADLASASPDVQFSFRDEVEPIHRQLVSLLIKSNQKDNLRKARDIIEALQLVELDNFFREPCLKADPTQIDRVDETAAVIYPIILENELAIIASLPKSNGQSQQKSQKQQNRDFRYYKTAIATSEIEKLVSNLRDDLQQPTADDLALEQLQEIYNLIIRPEAADLAATEVKTLVFVLDGVLRNVPMAALHDGKNFLVEKYSIALTPGLQLLAPRAITEASLEVLVGGLNQARPPEFPSLPYVGKEVEKIQSKLPSQVLFNQKFTNNAFEEKVPAVSYPIVHLATHGKFGSTADETFIITWDDKIKVNQLSSILKTGEISRDNPLELLVLSACETAAGDNRSALGLAGVAVRSGARSTIATLWRVNDEASAMLISKFYEQLTKPNKTAISKAEALRQAQINILKNPEYQVPYYWAAYVLLGNWT
ncbi:MAG: CHAT domain-containing protein [Rivularia sp. (in: Bacteria)]|nr:CHAT domain-containing protein [Rivularia sp. MS3]